MANKKNKKEENQENFFYKYKNDKKYKAKVELTGYVVFILLIILFVNIASLGNNTPSSNHLINKIPSNGNNTTTEVEKHLLETITNNYQYDINVNITKITEENILYRYHGKSYKNTLEINKEFNNTTTNYYKVDNYYYQKNGEEYTIIPKEEIYDLISNDYIELDNLLEYLEEASLDHVTNYSNGKREYVYNLYIRDIVISNKTDEIVTINIIEENNTLNISVDYFNLIKETDNTIKECKVTYLFSNINKIEEFLKLDNTLVGGEVNE